MAGSEYDKENIDFQILSPQPHKTSFLPRIQRNRDMNKKTLVLDLDETLVHSTFDQCLDSDITIPVNFEGRDSNIYVKIRPGAINFLQRIHKYYEVVIFTASVANYADPLVDVLDVDKYSFYKLFREHCTYNGNYLKDLSKLGRDLKDWIIVDNLPKSYSLQPENGLPISSWYDDQTDMELDKLYRVLIMLARVKDVRKYINKIVVNDKIDYTIVSKIFQKWKEHYSNLNILSTIIEAESNNSKLKEIIDIANSSKPSRAYPYKIIKKWHNENVDSTNKNRVENDYQVAFSNSWQSNFKLHSKQPKTHYNSPNKAMKRSALKTTITLEENYSQTK